MFALFTQELSAVLKNKSEYLAPAPTLLARRYYVKSDEAVKPLESNQTPR